MLDRVFDRRAKLLSAGERARRLHETWLTAALRDARLCLPRIPIRRVRDGGFAMTMSTTHGRRWAQSWWDTTLARPELRRAPGTTRGRRH